MKKFKNKASYITQVLRESGIEGFTELAKITCQHRQTLWNWSKTRPDLFYFIVLGIVFDRNLQISNNLAAKLKNIKMQETLEDG